MRRKPIAQVGQQVFVEGIDNPVEVLGVALAKDVFPFLKDNKKKAYGRGHGRGYAYQLKLKRVKPRWFLEYEINYVVTYTPLAIELDRHAELVQALAGYEMLRDFLNTLPHGKKRGGRHYKGGYPVIQLMKLVEYCGLLAEGTSQERSDAGDEIVSIMQ